MLKDEPFIQDTTNAFVAVESFRLSCAPNEGGIVYRMLPNTYAIQCERDVAGDTTESANIALKHTYLQDFFLDDQVVQGKKVVDFVPDKGPIMTAHPTINISDIIEAMMEDINPLAVTQGTVLAVVFDDTDDNSNPKVTVKDNPLTSLKGPALGPQGILPCQVQFTSHRSWQGGYLPPNGQWGEHPITTSNNFVWAQIAIYKENVPNIKLNDLAVFFSSRVNLYRLDCPTVTTKPYFQVFGPMFSPVCACPVL